MFVAIFGLKKSTNGIYVFSYKDCILHVKVYYLSTMIPQTAEYGLRAIVWIASRPEGPQTSDQIAAVTQVPPRYLYKVLQTLTEAGLVQSQPGPKGGYSLAQPANQISLLDVINTVAPIARITTCPLKLNSHATELCPLHHELDQAYQRTENAFKKVTIAQLLNRRTSVKPLC